ncbi:hypothetical protein IWQ60_000884 [Tieghemiomyces parasiticus]|uniref:SET domain-containing protein n=1 Tax=Tieghemiomyces parasiticus TaxID=78921 RepID=A0A9W8AKX0_9FUNG|nr:hypothetical protein IWQ60_000884 [Tieghemiomyces parasiticus]
MTVAIHSTFTTNFPTVEELQREGPSTAIVRWEDRGRGVMALQSIPAGTVILRSRAFANVVAFDWLKYVYYCDTTCQLSDAEVHNLCCPLWQRLREVWPRVRRQPAQRWKPMGNKSETTVELPVELSKSHLDHLRFITRCLVERHRLAAHPASLIVAAEPLPALLAMTVASGSGLPSEVSYADPLALDDPSWSDYELMQTCAGIYAATAALTGSAALRVPALAELYAQRRVDDYLFTVLQIVLSAPSGDGAQAFLTKESLPRALFDHILYRERANAFGYWDATATELVGYGVFPKACFFNHACAFNVLKVSSGPHFEYVTTRPIVVGEELCIYYGNDPDESVDERQERLFATYHFHCRCMRCIEESQDALSS